MFYNDKFHRETLARVDESRWSFESVFPLFFAVFSLKFQHIDQSFYWNNFTKHTS